MSSNGFFMPALGATLIPVKKADACPNCHTTERIGWTFSIKKYNDEIKTYYAYNMCGGCKYCWDQNGVAV
jgi:Pyruvate/2-oxoacid:ferredoxin oxidoreductase delta subunit